MMDQYSQLSFLIQVSADNFSFEDGFSKSLSSLVKLGSKYCHAQRSKQRKWHVFFEIQTFLRQKLQVKSFLSNSKRKEIHLKVVPEKRYLLPCREMKISNGVKLRMKIFI